MSYEPDDEELHAEIVRWGTKSDHDARFPNCKQVHKFKED